MKNSLCRIERGFTLIEALIAFLVLSVGLLGALLFHANLIKDSSDNKARLEALKIAEKAIEERKNTIYTSASSLAAAMAGATSTSVSGTTETFTISWENFHEVVSDAAYSQDVKVTWNGNDTPVVISTFYSWLNPTAIDADEAGTGEGGEYDNDLIPLPTGTLTALERAKVVSLAAGSELIRDDLPGSRANGNGEVVIYEDGDDLKVAVKLADNTFVQLAKLSQNYNEILTISGEIRNLELYEGSGGADKDIDRRLPYKFDRVFEDESGYLYDLIDIRASAGANCIITDWENDADNYADVARYLCVAGTGWNGNIYPYFRTEDPNQVADWDLTLIGSKDGLVCSPRQRNYRFYTLDLGSYDPDVFVTEDVPDLGASSATAIMQAVSAAVVGQSGLVRFYADQETRDLLSPEEGVVWSDYFWPNPQYLVSPGWASVDANQAYSVLSAVSGASGGYYVPSFTSVSSADFSVSYPGDVAYQNFIIGRIAEDVADCDDAIAMVVSGASPTPLDSRFLNEYGMPGYITSGAASSSPSQYGYVPAGALAKSPFNYDVQDFNAYDWDLIAKVTGKGSVIGTEYVEAFRGSIILGYALATESLKGRVGIDQVLIDNGILSFDSLVVVGNPEPTAAINCIISDSPSVDAGETGFEVREFSCPVPSGWSGRVLAHAQDLMGASLYTCDDLESDISYAEATDSSGSSDNNEIGRYIFEEILSLTDLAASAAETSWNTNFTTVEQRLGVIPVPSLPEEGDMYGQSQYSGALNNSNGRFLFTGSTCPP